MKNITISIVLLFIIHSYTVASERDITQQDIVVSKDVIFHKKDDLSWRDTKSYIAYEKCCIYKITGTLIHACCPEDYNIVVISRLYELIYDKPLMDYEFIRYYRKIEN